jgi:hypothetical protein
MRSTHLRSHPDDPATPTSDDASAVRAMTLSVMILGGHKLRRLGVDETLGVDDVAFEIHVVQ